MEERETNQLIALGLSSMRWHGGLEKPTDTRSFFLVFLLRLPPFKGGENSKGNIFSVTGGTFSPLPSMNPVTTSLVMGTKMGNRLADDDDDDSIGMSLRAIRGFR